MEGGRTTAGRSDDAVRRHLASVPPSLVGAADAEGFFVDLPSGFDLGDHEVFSSANVIETISFEDAPRSISMWEEAMASGTAECRVQMADGREATFVAFDARDEIGTLVVVATPTTDERLDPDAGAVWQPTDERPRLCRMEKSELAAIIEVDRAIEGMLGWQRDDLIGHRQLEFVHPDDSAAVVRSWLSLLSRPGMSQRLRVRHLREDGSYVWVEMVNQNRLEEPGVGRVTCDVIDISDQVEAEEALAAREQELSTMTEMLTELTESLPSGVAQFDVSGRLVYSNRRLFRLLTDEPVATLDDLLVQLVDDDQRRRIREAVLAAAGGGEGSDGIEATAATSAGDRVVLFVIRPLSARSRGAVVSVSDITDTVVRRRDLERRATRDPLTDCLNRDAVIASLDAALAQAGEQTGASVVFLDLDDFKALNDDLGHAAGDELLRTIADRLCDVVRSVDLVGRVGGDEFVVVFPTVTTADAAEVMASRLRAAIGHPALIESRWMSPGASLGVAWSAGGESAVEVLKRADAAMYEAKRRRKTQRRVRPRGRASRPTP